MESPWLIQTGWLGSMPSNRPSPVVMRDVRRAVLALAGGQHVPAELAGHELGPVADAKDRDPSAPDRWIRLGRVVVVHGIRAAAEDDRLGPAALQLLVGGVVWQQLGVDVQLAHPASDELGELAAEVQDHDRPGSGGRRETAGMVAG